MIKIKNGAEVEKMRRSAGLVADTLQYLAPHVQPGISTKELDKLAEAFIRSKGGVPSFLGYRGYKYSICTSVNDEVVHGLPGPRVLKEGDIISVDVGVYMDGFHGDAARTFPVGPVRLDAQKLLDVTREALMKGVAQVQSGARLGDVSAAIQSYAEGQELAVVRSLVGHGIGRDLHEDPQIPNFGRPGVGVQLKPGMVLAIEPMVNSGGWEVETLADGWTVVSADGSLSAHFEHTVAVTENGPDILSLPTGQS